jgi:hypothetical protein
MSAVWSLSEAKPTYMSRDTERVVINRPNQRFWFFHGKRPSALKPPPSPVLHKFRPRRPQDRPAGALSAPDPNSDKVGGSIDIASVPAPYFLAPQVHRAIAMFQQLGGRQRRAPGHPERPANLTLHPAVPGIREGCPLGSHPCHVTCISAPAAHFWSFSFLRDACY